MNRLLLESVSKRYRSGVQALSDVSLDVGPGVLGLLGPNGAGKSTLMRIVSTIMLPTSGSVQWNGIDALKHPNQLRTALGYLPQDAGVYPNLTAREFLRYVGSLKGLKDRVADASIANLLERLNLTAAANRPLGSFSGGMKQRIGIAQALLNDPQLLVVDEPTVGLDPEERARFRDLITSIANDRIIILSTHIVSDVESIAERVVMIAGGRVVGDGAPESYAADLRGRIWEGVLAQDALESMRERYFVTSAARRRDGIYVRIAGPQAPADFSQAAATLEEAYLVRIREARVA